MADTPLQPSVVEALIHIGIELELNMDPFWVGATSHLKRYDSQRHAPWPVTEDRRAHIDGGPPGRRVPGRYARIVRGEGLE